MGRIKVLLLIGGGFLAFFGYQEFKLGNDASQTPVAVDLAKLEAGEPLPNVHVQVGEHICIYTASVYRYNTSSSDEEATASSKVQFAYFPIISQAHPWFAEARAATARYGGDVDAVPEKEWPEIKQFAVLVKTSSRFPTVGSIPDEWGEGEAVSGLVINRVKKLSGEERDMIQQSFPQLDLEKVLILEEGRRPKSAVASLGMAGGGVLLAMAGLVWLVAGARS